MAASQSPSSSHRPAPRAIVPTALALIVAEVTGITLLALRSGLPREWLLPFLVVVTVVEGGAVHALLYALGTRGTVHALLLALNVYGLVWGVGDRRLLWQSAHRMEADALELSLGLRFSARVPYAGVERVLPLRTDAERRSVQPRGGRNPRVTPLDAPNVHLCLREPVRYTTLLGLTRRAQHLDLFVERPEEFIAALSERLPGR